MALVLQRDHCDDIGHIVSKNMPSLAPFRKIYIDLHEHPELGTNESRTSSIASMHLEELGFAVHRNVGGHGVVGVLENGDGKTILLRADMDALPIKEETGLPYASKARGKDLDGEDTPVMHACGHDMHITCLMAVASLLHNAKADWTGTLICLFQPDEEHGAGAQAMVDDGLYDIIPTPDLILGQHVDYRRSGNIAICPGTFMAAADSFDITIIGRGSHSSQPQLSIDPIVIAAYVLVRIQSIVSRFVAPLDTAVVSCGSIHGGSAENIIPDQVKLKLNVRTYKDSVRTRVLHSLKNIIQTECEASDATQEPIIQPTTRFPLTENDPEIAGAIGVAFRDFFGAKHTEVMEKLPGSEDFSNLARQKNIPYAFWFWGGTDPKKWDAAKENDRLELIPRPHSSKFAPVIETTMITGVQGLALAALRFLH